MDEKALFEALELTRDVAQEAGQVVLSGFRTRPEVGKKGAIDLVTEFDLKSEEVIKRRLERAFRNHDVVGEEGAHTSSRPYVWYVDPIDGTTNFAHGHPVFAVSIGLMKGAEPLLGVVFAPALAVMWSGARGSGVFRNGVPCKVSSTRDLDEALVATGFPIDRSRENDNTQVARAFLKKTRGYRRCASAAVDLAMVADGTYDLYWEAHLNPWDLAGGSLLVLEAGGQLSDLDGGPVDIRNGDVVASNGRIHDASIALMKKAEPSS